MTTLLQSLTTLSMKFIIIRIARGFLKIKMIRRLVIKESD